jgi:AraC family transcriptional regulator
MTRHDLQDPAATGKDGHRPGTAAAHAIAVERVVGYMKIHSTDPVDLNTLARVGAISKYHLVRVFEEITGTTPHHFLACLRIQSAKELLANPCASVTDVCMTVGYSSLGSFSKAFRRLVGLSPKDFRALQLDTRNALRFSGGLSRFLRHQASAQGPFIEGVVEGPPEPCGTVFIGTFKTGVPECAPASGTILPGPGPFRIAAPHLTQFHILALLVPLCATPTEILTNVPMALVASQRFTNFAGTPSVQLRLRLRPKRITDPPVVVALAALMPAGSSPEIRNFGEAHARAAS